MSEQTTCPQCGEKTVPNAGRCGACGAVLDVGVVLRRQRRDAALRVLGDAWYEWVGEAAALVVIALSVAGVLPVWSLAIAGVLLVRPISRFVVLALRGALDTS